MGIGSVSRPVPPCSGRSSDRRSRSWWHKVMVGSRSGYLAVVAESRAWAVSAWECRPSCPTQEARGPSCTTDTYSGAR